MTEEKKKYQKIYRETPKNKERARLAEIEYRKNEKRIAYRKEYRLKIKEKVRQEHQEMKIKVHNALGGKCIRCGFSDHRALQIDHVNSDGFKDKKEGNFNGRKHYVHVLLSILKKEGAYQLLCANCNWIKRFENNEHYKR